MSTLDDPVVLSTIVQTAVITLTLVIFILSFRSQNKAIQEQAYQKVMDDYGDAMRMLSDRPELYAFQLELFSRSDRPLGREQKSLSREDLIMRNYAVMMYGLFERIYALYIENGLTKIHGNSGPHFSRSWPRIQSSWKFINDRARCGTNPSSTTSTTF